MITLRWLLASLVDPFRVRIRSMPQAPWVETHGYSRFTPPGWKQCYFFILHGETASSVSNVSTITAESLPASPHLQDRTAHWRPTETCECTRMNS